MIKDSGVHNFLRIVEIIKTYYVISSNKTTILYKERIRNKWIKKNISFEGKYFNKIKPTNFNIGKKLLIEIGGLDK